MVQLTGIDLVILSIRKGDEARSLLTRINLTLSERCVAVIGADGSSKSNLLGFLDGMRQPTSGTVSVKGHDVAEESRKVHQLVRFVFTDPPAQLLMFIPIEDLTLSLGHLPRRERTGRAQQILDKRGLRRLTHQSIYDLSDEERQMMALASVLTVRPEVIMVDEPTTLLSLRNRLALRRALAGLEQQITYSTHDMNTAASADRAIVIRGGRVTADGKPGEVIAWYERAMEVTG